MRGSRWAVPLIGLCLGLVASGPGRTLAAFSDTAEVRGGAFTSGSLTPAPAPTVARQLFSRTVTWSPAVVNGGVGSPAASYRVLRYTSATSSQATVVCETTSTTCSDSIFVLNQAFYSVESTFVSWTVQSPRSS